MLKSIVNVSLKLHIMFDGIIFFIFDFVISIHDNISYCVLQDRD